MYRLAIFLKPRLEIALALRLLFLLCTALPVFAQEQEETRGAPAEPVGADEIRAQMAIAQSLLGKTPDRGAVLYFLAASNALVREIFPALEQLKQCLALKEGFDPSGDIAFAELATSPDFKRLLEQVHKDFPPVNSSRIAFSSTDKTIFPEGMAYDPITDSFYLSSLSRRMIFKVSREGKNEEFVSPDRYKLLPVQGIRLDPSGATIWSASSKDDIGKSELLHFDRNGLLIGRYPPTEEGKHDFNDLVVLRSGDVFVTDTLANKIYRFDRVAQTFSPVRAPRPLLLPNGITLTDDDEFLYVADQLGVLRINLKSGDGAEVDPGLHNTLAGIDGLYWHKGSLVAVQNGIGTPRIAAFRLTPDGLHVAKATVLQTPLKTPTTGALRGDDFYYIVNTQIDNLNGDHILDVTKLEPVHIAVVHLP